MDINLEYFKIFYYIFAIINGRFFIVFVEVCAILPRIDRVIRQRDGKASFDRYFDQCGGRRNVGNFLKMFCICFHDKNIWE